MRRFIFFICILSCGMDCNAATCIEVEKAIVERSNDYLAEIHIDVDKSDSNFEVSISFPSKLETSELTSLTLAKGGLEGGVDDFIIPLNVTPKNGRMIAWYLIGRNLSDSNIIEAVYGAPCGAAIRYKLDYQTESLESATID